MQQVIDDAEEAEMKRIQHDTNRMLLFLAFVVLLLVVGNIVIHKSVVKKSFTTQKMKS